MITLYHGSNIFSEKIDLAQCNPYKDFGQAFYLTTDIVQAKDVANARVDIFGGEPVVNEFHFDESLLSNGKLSFKSFDAYTEEWADFVYQHRDETNFPPYMHSYDVVYGPIANDRVGVQIGKYEAGDITLDQFLENLKYMKGVTFQYYFGTERAIAKLTKI